MKHHVHLHPRPVSAAGWGQSWALCGGMGGKVLGERGDAWDRGGFLYCKTVICCDVMLMLKRGNGERCDKGQSGVNRRDPACILQDLKEGLLNGCSALK